MTSPIELNFSTFAPTGHCHWCGEQQVIAQSSDGRAVCFTCSYKRCRRCGDPLIACQCPTVVCDRCGVRYGIGQSPVCKDGHDYVAGYHPFTPYFDFALGQDVTSHAHRWRLMKEAHVDYRDKMSPGDLSARLDRVEAQKREEAR